MLPCGVKRRFFALARPSLSLSTTVYKRTPSSLAVLTFALLPSNSSIFSRAEQEERIEAALKFKKQHPEIASYRFPILKVSTDKLV